MSMLSFCYFKEKFAAHAVINYYLSLLLLLLDFYESEKVQVVFSITFILAPLPD